MRFRPIDLRSLPILTAMTALVLCACGGDKPAERAAASATSSPAPAGANADAAAPPTGAPAAPAAPPEAPPPPASHPVSKPAATKATPKHEPAPAPRPEPVAKTIAAGTDLDVELLDAASSKTSQVGNSVRARVVKPIIVDGLTVIPDGAIIDGTVTEAIPLKKIGGAASLGLRFDTLELAGGTKTPISAGLHEQGKSETGKDAGTIAGATAGGAILGRLLSKHDKTKGTLIGAVVGAAAGTGAAAATKGQEIELPAGTPLALRLEQPLTVTVQP
jgi:glycine zipper 2TM protein